MVGFYPKLVCYATSAGPEAVPFIENERGLARASIPMRGVGIAWLVHLASYFHDPFHSCNRPLAAWSFEGVSKPPKPDGIQTPRG